MSEKEKAKDLEIEKQDIVEIEHKTLHPGHPEISLQNNSFAPGENDYLNENVVKKNPSHNCGGL